MVKEEKYTLKQLRGLRGMTQAELARKVGISETTIYEYETQEGRLERAKYTTIYHIAEALDVEVDDIFLDTTWIKSKRTQEA